VAPILSIDGLRTHFFAPSGVVHAVDGVSFDLEEGEGLGIVGESGSGKSIAVLSIVGLVPSPGRIIGGAVRFSGRDLLGLDAREMQSVRANDIAMIFQDAAAYLNPVMRIGEQIAEAIGKRRSREPHVRQVVIEALRAVQITEPERIVRSYPHELSGGMQQRVMIAAALVRGPRLIIADEPTTALDATVQFQVLQLIGSLRARSKASLILISHDLAVVRNVCDRLVVMYAGQVVESGPTAAILAAPQHPYTRALVDSILDPWDPRRDIVPLAGAPPDMESLPNGCRFHPRCRLAMDVCRRKEPPSFPAATGRMAACWLHEKGHVNA
jgi:oligopeptide/dipeptide ABC transporter ATP-binding protein